MRFTTKNTLALLATIFFTIPAFAIDDTIIPQASYLIYDREIFVGQVAMPDALSKEVTFYTFDGNPIVTIEHHHTNRAALLRKLDPSAPKPQPVSYEINKPKSVWNPFLILMGIRPTSFIIFYDKHDNVIAKFECYKKGKSLSIIITNPTVKPGHIGAFTKLTVPNFEFLRAITPSATLSLDLSRVTEKPRK